LTTRRNITSHLGLEASARSTHRTMSTSREGEGFSPDEFLKGESTYSTRKGTFAHRVT
jgi:hypothetical protein